MKRQGIVSMNRDGVLVLKGDFPELKAGMVVDVEYKAKNRSIEQNALYWLFCTYCGKQLGMTKEEVHEAFKYAFLKDKKIKNGKLLIYIRSTSKLSKEEFAEYFDRCLLLAGEYGVDVDGFFQENGLINPFSETLH